MTQDAPPRALHLLGSFHTGGSERQAVQLVSLLAAAGRFEVRAASLDPAGVLRGQLERLQIGPIESYPLRRFYDLHALRQVVRFARMLRRERIEILHTHDFYTNVFGMASGWLAGVPVRIASRREIGGVRTPAQKRVERAAYRLAHAIVANSAAVRDALVGEGLAAGKTRVVYNGLDLTAFGSAGDVEAATLRSEAGIPGEVPLVSVVANLRLPVKDLPTFLRAARRVRESVPGAHFAIAGEGELLEETHALAAPLGLGEHVRFLGRCDRVAALVAASQVCVLSSRSEGFSNAILEYMGGSRPVVATDVGGAREAVEDGGTGYLVPAGDDEAMARRVTELLLDPALACRMGARGRSIVEARFSCEAQLRSTETLYEELRQNSGGRPRSQRS